MTYHYPLLILRSQWRSLIVILLFSIPHPYPHPDDTNVLTPNAERHHRSVNGIPRPFPGSDLQSNRLITSRGAHTCALPNSICLLVYNWEISLNSLYWPPGYYQQRSILWIQHSHSLTLRSCQICTLISVPTWSYHHHAHCRQTGTVHSRIRRATS